MAKVKIQGHASGTGVFTVTAPNSNTDRTITLPDADVTLGTDATKLPLAGGTMTGNTLHGDNVASYYGASNDLQIRHSGSHSYIQDAGDGDLIVKSNGTDVKIIGDNDEDIAKFTWNDGVDLFFNGSKKFETTAEGILVTGSVPTVKILNNAANDSATSGKLSFMENDNTNGFDIRYDGSANNFIIESNNVSNALMIARTTGHVGIGASPSTSGKLAVAASTDKHGMEISNHGYYSPNAIRVNNADTINRAGHEINFNRGGSDVGSISTSTSATSYNTSSDYRLKENVDYTWDATTRLKQLKPARFNFIADDTNTLVDGFLAHEAATVVPECVTGDKDAMTAEILYVEGDEIPEGKVVGDVKTAATINSQGIDQSKLVPLLVKTIQELEARITALEAD